MMRAGAAALWSHWARHPFQLLVVIVGLALATGLWTGVQAINAQARTSYDAAARLLGQDTLDRIVAPDGSLTLADFAALRRQGWAVTPVVRARLPQTTVQILGVDPFTAPQGSGVPDLGAAGDLVAFLTPPGVLFAHPDTVADLAGADSLPPVRATDGVAPGTVVTDIATALRLSGAARLTALLILPGQRADLPALPPRLVVEPAQGRGDIARLTDSFHLNLTAFALLAFAVGLFIVHAAIGLAFEQRRGLFRTLRALGLTRAALTGLLVAEAVVLASAGGVAGIVLGYGVAAALLPNVAATLSGLYGAGVGGSLTLSPVWWLSGLAMSYAGVAVAAGGSLWQLARLPVLAPAMPRAWARARAARAVWQGGSGAALIAVSVVLAGAGNGLVAGFACLGALLLGAALLVPLVLSGLLSLAQGIIRGGPITAWVWADTRQQLPGLSMALMALLLALAANVGVSTMVGSFRGTFTGWLDQRLASELYVTAPDAQVAQEMAAYAAVAAQAVLPIVSARVTLAGAPAEVFGIADHRTYRDHWPLLQSAPGVWDAVAQGTGVLVNEQLARRAGLWSGTALALRADWTLPVVGVYSDYGNPAGQAIVGLPIFAAQFPEAQTRRFALRTDRAEALRADLIARFDLSPEAVVNQSQIKAFSLEVFEQTFLVTRALNVLTLGVAGFALWASLTTLAAMRLPQLAPVWALGLTRRRLAWLELGRALGLAALTALLAVPVGLALAWVLLNIVNVEAFGWRLPMQVFPWDWLALLVWALVGAGAAAVLPVWRLAKLPPAELLKVFAHAR